MSNGAELTAAGAAGGTATATCGPAPANGRGGGNLSSVLSRTASVPEAAARSPSSTWVNGKQAQESAIITAVRRQLEALEDRLSGRIAKEVARVQQQGDRLREAALARIDAKLATLEALQPKLDRRLAELSGHTRGLSEEMQSQIRRSDHMDSRFAEWRHQLDEDMRTKLAEIGQQYSQIDSLVRVTKATNEDLVKTCAARIVHLQNSSQDLSQSLVSLRVRVRQVEDLAKSPRSTLPEGRLTQAEVRIGSLEEHLEAVQADLELAPRVQALVAMLRDVAPKVIAHEEALGQLQSRLAELSDAKPRDEEAEGPTVRQARPGPGKQQHRLCAEALAEALAKVPAEAAVEVETYTSCTSYGSIG